MNLKNILFVVFSIIWSINLNSQPILGMEADDLLTLLNYKKKSKNTPDSYGRYSTQSMNLEVKYNGKKIEVITECITNVYSYPLNRSVDICKHYNPNSNNKIESILIEYKNVSKEEFLSSYGTNHNSNKIESYYFSKDYEQFEQIHFLNDIPCVIIQKTEINSLPKNIANVVARKKEELNRLKQLEIKENERIAEIQSKEYDLKKFSPEKYQKFGLYVKRIMFDYFDQYYLGWDDLRESGLCEVEVSSTYNLKFKRSANSSYGSITPKWVSGEEVEWETFQKMTRYIPSITYEKMQVNVIATFSNFRLDLIRGRAKIKLKNNKVSFKKCSPKENVQVEIIKKMKGKSNGIYIIEYEIGQVGDEDRNKISVYDR